MALGLVAIYGVFYFLARLLPAGEVQRTGPEAYAGYRLNQWAAILVVLWLFGPLILLSLRSRHAIAIGAGSAAAFYLSALLFAVTVPVGTFIFPLHYHLSYRRPLAISCLVLSMCCIWVIISALRIAYRAGWVLFVLSLAGMWAATTGALYMSVAH